MGKWEDDKQPGYGKYTFDSGNVYEGGMKDGNMNGHGKKTLISGIVCEGEWKDDKYIGPAAN